MCSNVKISIITATRNCADTLVDCLASIASQKYLNREHIIIDGASSDETLLLLEKYIDQIAEFLSEPDDGIYDALNKGIQRSTGDVIGFLHSDDIFASSDSLGQIAEVFAADPSVSAVYGDLVYVQRANQTRVVRSWRSAPYNSKRLVRGWMPPHPTLYVRRKWYERIGNFDKNFRVSADYFSVLQLFGHPEFKSVYIPRLLVKMRLGGVSNQSIHAIAIKSLEDWIALRRCGFNRASATYALFLKNICKLRQFF